mgnify:FL=1
MKICILGSGAYGLALASRFIKNNNEVVCYSNNQNEIDGLVSTRISDKLPSYNIDERIEFTTDIKRAVSNSNLVVIAVPAKFASSVTKELSNYLTKDMHILIATKGIENDTCLFLNDVVEKNLNTNKIAVISGPTFAVDIVKDVPIGFTLATLNSSTKELVKKLLVSDITKLRDTADLIGVEVCGSIKNVMAIVSGMLGGMGVTDSTRALFLTEALNDIKELIDALGGNKNTILSYAGFGDILMTCTSLNSRNYNYGKMIGEGKLEEANIYANNTTVEGLYTLRSIKELIRRENVKMPIIDLVSDIISGNKDKTTILEFLIKK